MYGTVTFVDPCGRLSLGVLSIDGLIGALSVDQSR